MLYFVVSMVDLTEISKKWQWLLAFNLGFFLLKTPLGVSANGNLAWLGVRGIPIQVRPAELVKLTFILLLARQLVWMKGRGDMEVHPRCGFVGGESAGDHRSLLRDLLRHGQRTGVCVYLRLHGLCRRGSPPVVRSGHLWRRGWLLPTVGAGQDPTLYEGALSRYWWITVSIRWGPDGESRSLMAIGGGRLTGQGLLHGAQTQSTSSVNLPFRHTDFIFAVIGEELGTYWAVC